ncbi:hypothetical protein ATANTOWER_013951 [Ataeniobius toweri]|uniref:Uncharacterized protein n=1 Tax=Ataeniobius toweri TaxID=208326 RepID=A0ABU7AXR8_9TELE|nr:hypothetical protein [Ataeniobius toweri]
MHALEVSQHAYVACCTNIKHLYNISFIPEKFADTHPHTVCFSRYERIQVSSLWVCVCIYTALSLEHKTPPHALCAPPLPWQLSQDAPTPGFLPLMAVSVCHLGKPDIPFRGRGPGINGSH